METFIVLIFIHGSPGFQLAGNVCVEHSAFLFSINLVNFSDIYCTLAGSYLLTENVGLVFLHASCCTPKTLALPQSAAML